MKTRSHATFRSVIALMLREMSTRYGKTPGGYLWAILEPIAAISIMALAFSIMLRSPSLGNSFILFYASGFLPFNIYQSVSVMSARSILFSRPLLFYPSVTWMDAILARFLLNTLTGYLIAFVVMSGVLALSDTAVVLRAGPILSAMVLSALMGLSVGTMNCLIMGLYPTWDVIWSIATRPLFIISGIIFIYEDLPRAVQNILWFNPLVHITGLFRSGVFPMYSPNYISIVYVMGWILVPMVVGMIGLRRYHRDILNG
ncbi:ABC transporter permease [Pseudooceanicola nanhaiensis]|uniref:ABC transporter permease n=1 Tax=Pseudooceanicola nanhaiensis TaxID=375761 RepID=UPI001CD19BF7|nr:ABC transporter permease [Pseudooceanicola nanhaiensis]MCA0922786.1 ABC transporter permease [Pseudooceanicola nanhaiensis]